MGVSYHQGKGIAQDAKEALKWYAKAADQGHLDSKFNLGILYLNGNLIPQDYLQGHMWFDLAARAGDAEARTRLEDVKKAMSPEQIALSIARADNWAAAHSKP